MGIKILPPPPTSPSPPARHSDSPDDVSMDDISDANPPSDLPLKHSSTSILTPGDLITTSPAWMRGHGTTTIAINSTAITATLAGTLHPISRLLSLLPLRARYTPAIGDLVLGRVAAVAPRRWLLDISAPLLASLPLSAINLPGGVLRRRTGADELQMRGYLQEGDVVSCEVRELQGDGSGGAVCHMRGAGRYGKLRNGGCVEVGAGGSGGRGKGVVRGKRQMVTMKVRGGGEVDVLLGVNGWVWVGMHVDGTTQGVGVNVNSVEEAMGESGRAYASQNEEINSETRREIARIMGCVRVLAEEGVKVDEESVARAYEAAVEGEVELEMGIQTENGGEDGEMRKRIVEAALG